MKEYKAKIREEEVKNILREGFFQEYDATPILGDIDFAVTLKTKERELFDKEFFLWAEAKRNPKDDLIDSFIQLIITIGKAKAHEKWYPPFYIGAFDYMHRGTDPMCTDPVCTDPVCTLISNKESRNCPLISCGRLDKIEKMKNEALN